MDVCYRGRSESLEVSLDGKKFTLLSHMQNVPEKWGEGLCRWVARQFPAMPHSDSEVIPLPKLFLKSSFQREEVCFYGGSFNPWHRGHLSCLELCPEGNILMIPDRNPWKSPPREGNHWNDYWELCHMLRDSKWSVYPGFLYKRENPTVDWLPGTHFVKKSLLLGADNFLSLDRWKECFRLVTFLDTIYVVPRGEHEYEEMTERLRGANPDLDIVILPRHPYEDLSSSGK